MNRSKWMRMAFATPALLIAACESETTTPDESGLSGDPAIEGALGDQIMVDPDLAGQNEANSALTTGARSGSLPAEARSPEAIKAAKDEATAMLDKLGGLQRAPEARQVNGELPQDAALTVAARAAALAGETNCAEKAEYTMQWAARLPGAFPVYPKGAVQEAAGSNEDGCSLRVVNFITPVPLNDVMDFYYSRAATAGYSTQRVKEGTDDMLGGSRGGASFVIYLRQLSWGGTEVDLITSGR